MKTAVVLAVALAFTAQAFPDEHGSVRLDVSARIVSRLESAGTETKPDVVTYFVEIHSKITNVGTEAITVPTSTYDGNPTCTMLSDAEKGICFSIGYRYAGATRLTPSSVRFFAVVLKPGESTELPDCVLRADRPTLLRRAWVEYEVEKDYAANSRWWFGKVKREVDVQPLESDVENPPNNAPEATPGRRPPAASTQPSGAPQP